MASINTLYSNYESENGFTRYVSDFWNALQYNTRIKKYLVKAKLGKNYYNTNAEEQRKLADEHFMTRGKVDTTVHYSYD